MVVPRGQAVHCSSLPVLTAGPDHVADGASWRRRPAHPIPEPSTEDRPSEIPVSASPGEFIFTGGGWGFPGFISGLIVPI